VIRPPPCEMEMRERDIKEEFHVMFASLSTREIEE
jgi:hypothetical protein